TDAEAPDCPVVTFGAGWFVRDGSGPLRKLRFDADLADCERYGLLYMLPLGAIRLSNRLFWIAQWSGWDFEEYGVVEIKAKRIGVGSPMNDNRDPSVPPRIDRDRTSSPARRTASRA